MADTFTWIWGMIQPLFGWATDAGASNQEMLLKGVAALIVLAVFVVVGKKIVGTITELMGKFWWFVALGLVLAIFFFAK